MQFLWFFVVFIGWNNSDSYSAAKGTQAKGHSAVSLVRDSHWTSRCIDNLTPLDSANSTGASFTGSPFPDSCTTCSSLCKDGELEAYMDRWKGSKSRLEMLPLQADEQKTCRVLPVLWNTLGDGDRHLGWSWRSNPKKKPECSKKATKFESTIPKETKGWQRRQRRKTTAEGSRDDGSESFCIVSHCSAKCTLASHRCCKQCCTRFDTSDNTLSAKHGAHQCIEKGISRRPSARSAGGHRQELRHDISPADEGSAFCNHVTWTCTQSIQRCTSCGNRTSSSVVETSQGSHEAMGRTAGSVQAETIPVSRSQAESWYIL